MGFTSLVAKMGNQDMGGPVHGGVLRQGAGEQHVRGGVDGQRDGGGQVDVQCRPQLGSNESENQVQDGREQSGGVHGGGGDGEQEDGEPGGDDGCRASPGPGGGHGLLVFTAKRRGRPKKAIVPDGLVQLRNQNKMRGIKRKSETGCHWPDQLKD